MKPQFKPGDAFIRDGIHYRVRAGNRCEGDMVLEISLDGSRWRKPNMSLTHILADFKAQVEENNYGPNGRIKRARGANFFIERLLMAIRHGWRAAADKTADEANLAFGPMPTEAEIEAIRQAEFGV